MHGFRDESLHALGAAILKYSEERLKLDPVPLDGPRSEEELDQLSADAKEQFAPQITEVKTQAAELGVTLKAATAAPSEASISAARRDVGELKNAFLDLQAALQATC